MGRMVNAVPLAHNDGGRATPPPVAGFPPKYTQAHYEEVRWIVLVYERMQISLDQCNFIKFQKLQFLWNIVPVDSDSNCLALVGAGSIRLFHYTACITHICD